MTIQQTLLERCKGRKDEGYITLTAAELRQVQTELTDREEELADHVKVSKQVKDIKALCSKAKPKEEPKP